MARQSQLIYWDSCVVLAYMNDEPARVPIIEGILTEVSRSNGAVKLTTSMVAKVEVAYVALEKNQRSLDSDVEQRIDDFWNDDSVIELVELHDEITRTARTLMRQSMASRHKTMKPLDAIHLATAIYIGAKEFQTYNVKDFIQFSDRSGPMVCEPHVDQTAMPF